MWPMTQKDRLKNNGSGLANLVNILTKIIRTTMFLNSNNPKLFQSKNHYLHVLIIASILIPGISGCDAGEDTVPTGDAWSEIYAAIEFKDKECEGRPDHFLLVPDNPKPYSVRLCSLSIIRLDCPFNEYPLFCLTIYGIELPGIGE